MNHPLVIEKEELSLLRLKLGVEQNRLYQLLESDARTAFGQRGMIEHRFVLQGHPFSMRFAGTFLVNTMSRALAHLKADATKKEPELTIDCWGSADTGLSFPQPDWPAKYFSGRGDIMGLDSPQMRIGFFGWLKLLNAYFPEKRRAFYCLEHENPFSLQQMGSPALTIFNWWGETLGFQLVHAAAVGTERGAVLIVGHGGAGKSTLAFSTLGSELRYISDDYTLLSGPPGKALALFSTGKLTESSLSLLPHLREQSANRDDAGREKALFYLAEQFPGELLPEAPLRAVVLSHLSEGRTFLEEVDAHEAHATIVESTLQQLAGTNYRSFIQIRRLLHELPVYHLHHGGDRSAVHRLLLQLCES